eukprot:TRINITY_DN5883_c0_g1_i9.p1 TRINITY_DN5883_c0_g1~~TRINITY_DN5883_c0_g1_i9.p1  ORF type:complete len:105 (+),score=4.40 TRINITY_DN5883_c0_g1_i9:884-1198(+)
MPGIRICPPFYRIRASQPIGKVNNNAPANPKRIAEAVIISSCASFSGYSCKTALAPHVRHLYKDLKKAFNLNLGSLEDLSALHNHWIAEILMAPSITPSRKANP